MKVHVNASANIFTKKQREHGLVVCRGQTGGSRCQQAAQSAGVWQQRLPDRLVDSVPVVRGHEAHKVRTCASTTTAVTRCAGRLH